MLFEIRQIKFPLGVALAFLVAGVFNPGKVSAQANPDSYFVISSQEGRIWSVDSTSPLPNTNAAVPSVAVLANGNIRLFFCGGPAGMGSATSSDGGKTFNVDPGSRILGACDGTFIYRAGGGFRFLTTENLGTTFGRSQIVSYVSNDGLAFTKENGVRYAGGPTDAGFTGVPSVVKLPDGRYRLYYVGSPLTPGPSGNGVRTAVSSDEGVTWNAEATSNLLPRSYVDPEVIRLSGGGYRMYYRRPDTGIGYADSSDGLSFSEAGVVLADRELADPVIIKLGDGTLKMFLGYNDNRMRSATSSTVARTRLLYFSQVADGGGFSTTFTLPNTTPLTITGVLRFINPNGTPRTIRINGVSNSQFDLTIPAGGSARMKTDNIGPAQAGWAVLETSEVVQGIAAFDLRDPAGRLLTTAAVLGSTGIKKAALPVEVNATTNTGIAVAYVGGSGSAVVRLRLIAESGVEVGNLLDPRLNPLGAQQQVSDLAGSFFGSVSGINNFRGTLIVEVVGAGDIALTGLLVKEGLLSALPVIDLTGQAK